MTDTASATVQPSQLRSIVERIERLIEERKEASAAITEVYAEANGNGLDVKALRETIKRRAVAADKLAEADMMVGLYEEVLDGRIVAAGS